MRRAVRVILWGLLSMVPINCAVDERDIQLVTPSLRTNAGSGGQGPGTGSMPEGGARLAVNAPAMDFGNVTVGFPSRARITLRNEGTAVLLAPSVAWSTDSTADFQVIQNQCGAELAEGESCEVRVQFVPSRAGTAQARLEVRSANGGTAVIAFTGQGLVAGDLILAPALGSFEDFGGVNLGSSVEGRFTVSNPRADASGPLTFSLNRPEFSLLPTAVGDCTPGVSELSNGQSCDVRIAFVPSERGLTEATLTATSPAGGSVSLTLSGRGLLAGVLSASNETLDFGGVVLQQSAQATVRFENTGDQPLTLGGARLEPMEASQFSILNSDCGEGLELAAGTSCGVQLQYRPTASDAENTAELVVAVVGGEPLRIALLGRGLEPGALELAAAEAAGSPDFGEVLLGESQTRTFTVANPGDQPSGVLSLTASGGFEVVTPPEGTDCIDGTTSLGTGESCTVRVSFAPALRQPHTGTLTVSSALAGASSLPLTGRGIVDAAIDVVSQVDFGRVLTNASAVRTVTIKNSGDRELPAPSIDITGDSSAQQAAFTYDSTCSAPLALGEGCDVLVTLAPSQAVPHSANLRIVADPGGTASVLLLGQALSPGSLQLSVAGGASPDFGDVPIGTTVTRSFVLTNPGNEPSGRITVSSDDNHFQPSLGDCNQGSPDGLVDGSSCTFSVAFTPDGSTALVANLSVQSPGAGRAGLEIRGRGRSPVALRATGNRDLGRANIGQAALTQAQNSFTWTVSNDGDLPTGTLRVDASNRNEFPITNDGCSNAQLQGRSSCQMTIRFVPSNPPGNRQATVTVTDVASGSAATVALTGLAVQLAALGESCINAECAQGVCTARGVCCDRACDRTCQVCSATGQCIDQSNQEPCGGANGAARCFGVDQCKLPANQPCGSTADCGGDLLCKQCTTGGSRCTAPADCCGACPGTTSCQGGTCGCSAQEISCGGNLCIPTNRRDVCCPVDPDCPADLPACRSDGRCVQCLSNADCGACGTCNTALNTCQPVARGQRGGCDLGQLCDGNGSCFTPQCTAVGQCGDCRTCMNFSCVLAGQGAGCSNNRVCTAAGQCVQCINANQCQPGQSCDPATNSCFNLCQPTAEVCDQRDNDCDGDVDEGFSLQTDPNNCGRCGNSCGGAACVGGTCNRCVPNPCQNGGTCNSDGSCTCPANTTGPTCATAVAVGPPVVSFCQATGTLTWPTPAEETTTVNLTCQTPTIAGLVRADNSGGLKSIRARLSQVPSGNPARAVVYGMDANFVVVCQVEDDIPTSNLGAGFTQVNCPASAVSWIGRIEN